MNASQDTHEYPELDVMAVGAHPDDVEIACGGTLAVLARQGYRVGIVDLTDGEPTPGSASPEVRLAEAHRAAETLGATVRVTLDLSNRRLFDSFEARVALAAEFRKYRPRLVIGFGDGTRLASPDHYQAMLITDAAVFYSRLSKWEEHFDDLEPHSISRQLYFTLAFHTLPAAPAASHFVVDCTDTIDTKIASIACYESQFAHRPEIFDRLRAIAAQAGIVAGYAAGELIVSPRTLGTIDPMGLLFPE